jgi:methionyl aminopeptidase
VTAFASKIIKLKDEDWLERQRVAGLVVAKCLYTSKNLIEQKIPNLSSKDIEKACHEIIKDHDCTPTFFNFKGFPGIICVSVNEEIVHGIPNDYVFQEGDVIKVDVGATYNGAIGDAAITAIYGEPKNKDHLDLVQTCEKALYSAISAVKVGKRLGAVGEKISEIVRFSKFGLITRYGGHGIGESMHAEPFVPNKSSRRDGVVVQPGLVFTIEPMLTIKKSHAKTKIDSNGWTIKTKGVSSHWEHSLYVHEDRVEIITDLYNVVKESNNYENSI